MLKIDKIDREIVNWLLKDGRMSATEIARHMEGVTERIVRYRIDRMIENKIIQISAIANPNVFGLDTCADILMQVESDKIFEVANQMVGYENVTYVACSIGESDVSAQVVAKDTDEIYQFVTEVVRKIPGVKKTVTSIVPIILKDIYQWRIPASLADNDEES